MLKVKITGDWDKLNGLLRNYKGRLNYVSQRIAFDAAKALLDKVKELSPDTPEFRDYIESLEVVEVARGKKNSFAVVSSRDKVKLKDLEESEASSKTVVYIRPTATDEESQAVMMLSSVNPWPLDLVPHGIVRKQATLIHRVVTDGEMELVRKTATEFIANNEHEMGRYGIYWGDVKDQRRAASSMKSLPDYMWFALRAEFGVNAEPHPHWRPAVSWLISNLLTIIEEDDVIRETLTNELSREHTMNKDFGLKQIRGTTFEKQAGKFQSKVLG